MDHRAAERWDARKTSAEHRRPARQDRPHQAAADDDPGRTRRPAWTRPTRSPRATCSPPGTREHAARDLRDGLPAAVHAAHRPGEPGHRRRRRVLPRPNTNNANRAPAGTCEWNLIDAAGLLRLAVLRGRQLDREHVVPLELRDQRDDRLAVRLLALVAAVGHPLRARRADPGRADVRGPGEPARPGRATRRSGRSTPARPAARAPPTSATSARAACSRSPVRSTATTRPRPSQGAFPRYYDGSWLINNRGADNGFWKEVQLRKDNNQMLRVNDWLPYNSGATSTAQNSSLVIGTQFGADGALYMARFSVGCCRYEHERRQPDADREDLVQRPGRVPHRHHGADHGSHEVTGQAYPDTPSTYVNSARLRLTATDVGCAGVKNDRVPGQRRGRLAPVHDRGHLRRGPRPTASSTARPTRWTTSPRSRRRRSPS